MGKEIIMAASLVTPSPAKERNESEGVTRLLLENLGSMTRFFLSSIRLQQRERRRDLQPQLEVEDECLDAAVVQVSKPV